MTKLYYNGHGSYKITSNTGKVVYVDPFIGEGYDDAADLILVTHEHFDHNDIDRMPHVNGCAVIRAKDLHPKPEEYLSVEVFGIGVTAVEAYNKNHPKDECVGFLIQVDEVSLYASGDTSTTELMKSGELAELGLDYALFCTDGFYNMGPEEAGDCAKMVGAAHSIPVHMGAMHGPDNLGPLFIEEKAAAFDAPGKLVVRPGETIELLPFQG